MSNVSSELFKKIRSRFSHIQLGDESGQKTIEPTEARFFRFHYEVNGDPVGLVNIKIDEKNLTVIYNESMLDSHEGYIREQWFNFLKEMRHFARKNLLTFDTRDITKSNLEKRDYAYLVGENKMNESKMFGTSRTSYQKIGEARIIIKHNQPINVEIPTGRSQHIESIYIESANGERFRYPFKHLSGARAMAVHVSNGGNSYDQIGSYISNLSEELNKLRQFRNYSKKINESSYQDGWCLVNKESVIRGPFVAKDDADHINAKNYMGRYEVKWGHDDHGRFVLRQKENKLIDITNKVHERIDAIKEEINKLQKQNYYTQFKESFQPQVHADIPDDVITEWVDALTIKTFNEDMKSVFPYIYKLVGETKVVTYEDIIKESTCPKCKCDPCTCDEDELSEVDHLEDFDKSLSTISEYEPRKEEDEEECSCDEGTTNRCEDCDERMKKQDQEIIEFITSMYDSSSKTFPKGDEGVIIATEKKFGDRAGRFARFAVEKLNRDRTDDLSRIKKLSGI